MLLYTYKVIMYANYINKNIALLVILMIGTRTEHLFVEIHFKKFKQNIPI